MEVRKISKFFGSMIFVVYMDKDTYAYAARHGRLDIIRLLANEYGEDFKHSKAAYYAAKQGHIEIFAELTRLGFDIFCKPFDSDERPFHAAIKSGRLQIVQLIIQHDPSKGSVTQTMNSSYGADRGMTPLHIAARYDRWEIAEVLLAHGADLNAKDVNFYSSEFGYLTILEATPLFIAAAYGSVATACFLIRRGANINEANPEGHTPTHMAAGGGHEEMLRFIASTGVDLNVLNSVGENPLDWYARYCADSRRTECLNVSLIRFLMTSGCSTAKSKALFVKSGYCDVITSIEKGFSDTQIPGVNIIQVGLSGTLEQLRKLIQHGADVKYTESNSYPPSRTLIELFSKRGDLQSVQFLFENHPSISGVLYEGDLKKGIIRSSK